MRFRPDWLRQALTAPYLGPVHPDTSSAEVLNEIVATAADRISSERAATPGEDCTVHA